MTREEYGSIYQISHNRTLRFLLARGASATVAADITQSAWVRGWERLSQLREAKMILTWINTIALNEYRRYMRREGSLNRSLPVPKREWAGKAHMNLAAIEVSRILAACNPGDRLLLEAQMNGITPKEIADEYGITETAVRIRFLRARRSARAVFGQDGSLNDPVMPHAKRRTKSAVS
jgi:RNA polymerase sigma factor (sigma-70 family)